MSLVYLAGPMDGLTYVECDEWRRIAAERLKDHGITAVSPLRGKRGVEEFSATTTSGPIDTDAGITGRDRWDVQRADMVFVNLFGAAKVSIGTMIELGWADAARVPVVVLMSPNNIHNHPMVRNIATYLTDDFDEALDLVVTALRRP